jgi:hypothetical protein
MAAQASQNLAGKPDGSAAVLTLILFIFIFLRSRRCAAGGGGTIQRQRYEKVAGLRLIGGRTKALLAKKSAAPAGSAVPPP